MQDEPADPSAESESDDILSDGCTDGACHEGLNDPLFEGEFHWLVKRLAYNEDDILERMVPYVRVRLTEVSDAADAEAEFNRLCREALGLLHDDQRMEPDLKAIVEAWGDMDRWWCIAELREWIAAQKGLWPYQSGFQQLESVHEDEERTL